MHRPARTTWRTVDQAVKNNEGATWQEFLDEMSKVIDELWVKGALHDGLDSGFAVADVMLAAIDPQFRAARQERLTMHERRVGRDAQAKYARQKFEASR